MATFIGIVHKEGKSDFGVSFPDFPGCITAGRTMQEAMEMAHEALRGHIEVMHEHGDKLPSKATPLDVVRKSAGKDTLFIMVEAPIPSKPVRVNVMLDSNILHRIDREYKNRSEFLNRAALHELERRPG